MTRTQKNILWTLAYIDVMVFGLLMFTMTVVPN